MDWISDAICVHRHPVGPLRHHCLQCSAPGTSLLRCGGCLAVRYCCRDHQVAHRPLHKGVCTDIKRMRTKLAKEDYGVRHATEDLGTPANAFETDVGRFWGLFDTRDYMRARLQLAENLRLIGTLDSVHEALDHMLDMLRLCRPDNLGVRNLVPPTMLRLDLDQECYDFMKWWDIHNDGDGNWSETHHSVRGADVLGPSNFTYGAVGLSHRATVLILKLKILVDIRNLKITRKLRGTRHLPQEVWEMIETAVVRSPLSATLQKQLPESLYETETKLLDQIRKLGTALASSNPNYMAVLFDPNEALSASPPSYTMGSWEEAALTIQYTYPTWVGTESVLEILNDARTYVEGDFGNGSRVWEHINDAAENAAYLGPRP